jgi:hypothetical protein
VCTTYERKTRYIRYGAEERYPVQIRISVEPTTPCATKTIEKEKSDNHQMINGRRIFLGRGSSIRSVSSTIISQVSTLHGGGSS